MHDNCIVGYSVNLEEKSMVIQTDKSNEKRQIFFSEVLTHCFKCILEYNIILDIQECKISSFIKENKDELMKMEGYCWPIDYQDEQELMNYLVDNEYKYIKINSSYGMFGWVLAKSYKYM